MHQVLQVEPDGNILVVQLQCMVYLLALPILLEGLLHGRTYPNCFRTFSGR
jgi:hypothetical protein